MKNGKEIQVLKLYPNVIPVRGYNRSLLVDLLKGTPYFVPNALIDYLEENRAEACSEYEEFILQHELGIRVSPEIGAGLTPLPLDYYPASKINNAILELDEQSSWDLRLALNQLDELGTQFLEVRFLDYPSIVKNLEVILDGLADSTIEFLQILVPFHEELKHFLDSKLQERFFRLGTIVVYNARTGFELRNNDYNLVFTSQESVSHEQCGKISAHSFVINTEAYVRNRNYNSCLAHKISVDKDGLICNCPSATARHGQLNATTFQEVLMRQSFRESWNLTKDRIPVCSVCEFRWICTDCRAFTVNDLKNGKPAKCGYNPFISLWAGEAGYLPEDECGVVLNGEEMKVDHELIGKINQKLWN